MALSGAAWMVAGMVEIVEDAVEDPPPLSCHCREERDKTRGDKRRGDESDCCCCANHGFYKLR